ncbi:hypothetical protein [Nocardia albiluteola]|nr:hypothetical protein [Nocardia albiluteola]
MAQEAADSMRWRASLAAAPISESSVLLAEVPARQHDWRNYVLE